MLQRTSAVQKRALSALGKELLNFSSPSNSQGGVFSKEGKTLYAKLEKALAEFLTLKAQQNRLRRLSCEGNDHIFYQQIFEILLSLEKSSFEQERVLLLLQSLIHSLKKLPSTPEIQTLQQRVQEHLGLYKGQGPLGAQVAFGLKRLTHDKRNLVTLAGMGLGMSAFGLTRLTLLRNGTGVLRANLAAFASEGMLFTGGEMLAESALHLSSAQSAGKRLLHGYATMGILRGVGTAFGLLGQSGMVQSLTARSSTARFGFQQVMPRVAEIGGLSLSHAALEGQNLSDSLRAGVQGALHFAFLRGAIHGLAPGLAAFNHRIQLQTQQAIYENSLSWMRGQSNQLRNLFNQGSSFGRRFAPLGPDVIQMAKHDSLSAAKEYQELWGESRMDGGAAPDTASIRKETIPLTSGKNLSTNEKHRIVLTLVSEGLTLGERNRARQRALRTQARNALKKYSLTSTLYELHQIPHGRAYDGTLLTHLFFERPEWHSFLLNMPHEAAKGLLIMARHREAWDPDSLVRRLFETDHMRDSYSEITGESSKPIGYEFLNAYQSLVRLPGIGNLSRTVTKRRGMRLASSGSIEWGEHKRPSAWLASVARAIRIADILNKSSKRGSEPIRISWGMGKTTVYDPHSTSQEIPLMIDILRNDDWIEEVHLRFQANEDLSSASLRDMVHINSRLATLVATQADGLIAGINFHITANAINIDYIDAVSKMFPNVRIIHYQSLGDKKGRVVLDQRNWKDVA